MSKLTLTNEDLTPEVEAKKPGWIAKWTAIGLRCKDPIDLKAFIEGAKECYRWTDLDAQAESKPRLPWVGDENVHVVPSPMAGAKLASAAITPAGQKPQWCPWLGGQTWASWHAYVTFFRDCMDWYNNDKGCMDRMAAYEKCALNSFYWWPLDDKIFVSERPQQIHLDDAGVLHCETGKAIWFSDGWGQWKWHGVTVTEQIIMHPETITADQVAKETNLEVSRIMIERMGPKKYMAESGSKIIDMDSLTLVGSAPRALVEDARKGKWLMGSDGGTSRLYIMAVPPEVMTCAEAHQAISGLDREDRLIAEC